MIHRFLWAEREHTLLIFIYLLSVTTQAFPWLPLLNYRNYIYYYSTVTTATKTVWQQSSVYALTYTVLRSMTAGSNVEKLSVWLAIPPRISPVSVQRLLHYATAVDLHELLNTHTHICTQQHADRSFTSRHTLRHTQFMLMHATVRSS